MASSRTNPLKGAALMVLAGLAFALANALTQIATFQLGFKAQSDTFWQYAVALIAMLPTLLVLVPLGLAAATLGARRV